MYDYTNGVNVSSFKQSPNFVEKGTVDRRCTYDSESTITRTGGKS